MFCTEGNGWWGCGCGLNLRVQSCLNDTIPPAHWVELEAMHETTTDMTGRISEPES